MSRADRTSSSRASRSPGWEIDSIVANLRSLRDASLAERSRVGRPPKLPSRRLLAELVEGLASALFPNRLGSRELADESVDFFVGRTLDVTLAELIKQIIREFQFTAGQDVASEAHRDQAASIVGRFAKLLPEIRATLESDLRAAYEGDSSAGSVDEVLACNPGILAIVHYRLAHALHQLGAPLVARIIGEIAHSLTGIDIHPGAQIGSSFFIDHGTGVVIGETAVIGNRVRLYQAVTLGAKRVPPGDVASSSKRGARHPILEDDVVIYAGASLLGRITIGQGSVIGGNVWLTESVPPASRISQAQVRNEDFEGGLGI